MPRIDTKQFYKAALKKYAQTPQGVHWSSLHSQQQRFKMIKQLLPSDLRHYTLVDAGCGFGDFYTFLEQHNTIPKEYIGVDCLDFMCSIASRNTQQTILQQNLITPINLPQKDFYICSGALNTLTKFESYQFIHNCFLHANVGVIFNILYGTKESQTYNYFTMQDINTLAQTLRVTKKLIKKGYLKNDITVGFFKI